MSLIPNICNLKNVVPDWNSKNLERAFAVRRRKLRQHGICPRKNHYRGPRKTDAGGIGNDAFNFETRVLSPSILDQGGTQGHGRTGSESAKKKTNLQEKYGKKYWSLAHQMLQKGDKGKSVFYFNNK